MSNRQQILSVYTLGNFIIAYDRKPVAVQWPDIATKMLFCVLLSPMDVSISRDLLCKALWNTPESMASNKRLTAVLGQLNDLMAGNFGINPVIVNDDGYTLDYEKLYVDAHDFSKSTIAGFKYFAKGETGEALRLFQQALELYHGEFLPGITGKIIESTRTDLEEYYQMLVKKIKPLPRLTGIIGTNSRSIHEKSKFITAAHTAY